MRLLFLSIAVFTLSHCSVDKMLGKHTDYSSSSSSSSNSKDPFNTYFCYHLSVKEVVTSSPTASCPSPGAPDKIILIESRGSFSETIRLQLKNPSLLHKNKFVSGSFISNTWGRKERNLVCKEIGENEYECSLEKKAGDRGGFYYFQSLTIRNECGTQSQYVAYLPEHCRPTSSEEVKIGDWTVPHLSPRAFE